MENGHEPMNNMCSGLDILLVINSFGLTSTCARLSNISWVFNKISHNLDLCGFVLMVSQAKDSLSQNLILRL